MRKNKAGRKFGRMCDQRKALLRNLTNALILHGKIITTEPKAKEIRRFIEPIISRARVDTIANRRLTARRIKPAALKKLFSEIGPKYKERRGGYTRIVRRSERRSDFAKMALIEFL